MASVAAVMGMVMVLLAAAIAIKHTSERVGRRRSAEMMKVAREKWGPESDLETLAFFYDHTVRQMYRLKHTHRSFEYLVDDVNLILELRNSIIENLVIREVGDEDAAVTRNP